jgi:hypothetical protein
MAVLRPNIVNIGLLAEAQGNNRRPLRASDYLKRAPRVSNPAEAAIREVTELLSRAARSYAAQETDLAAHSIYGAEFITIQKVVRPISEPGSGARLIELVRDAALRAAPPTIKFIVLRMIGIAIARHRVRQGWPPFDDAIGDEELRLFERCRELLS